MMRALPFAAAVAIALAPAAGAAALDLPPVTKATLRNGLTVYVMPTRRLPLVDYRLVARAGSAYDPAGREGLANLTAELLTQGAGRRTAKQIAEAIESVGGELEAFSGTEQLVVSCEVLRKDAALGLELLRDVVVQPTVPASEFEREKDEALGALAARRDDPSAVIDAEAPVFLWGEGPLAHPAAGWESSVKAITRDDVVAFHRRRVTPRNSLLAVVGDVDPKRVIADLEKAFAGWKGPAEGAAAPVQATPAAANGIRIVSKPEVTQSQIRLLAPGVPRRHPDYHAITVANTVLGGGFTSRLVEEIRVKRGLTYSIRSRFNHFTAAGNWTVTTFTRNDSLRVTVDAVTDVIRRLASEGPTEAELDKARRFVTGQFPLGLQAPDDLAEQLTSVAFAGLDVTALEQFTPAIQAVTMADVKRVLREHFDPSKLRVLVVSNPEVAQKLLAGLGETEVVAIR